MQRLFTSNDISLKLEAQKNIFLEKMIGIGIGHGRAALVLLVAGDASAANVDPSGRQQVDGGFRCHVSFLDVLIH